MANEIKGKSAGGLWEKRFLFNKKRNLLKKDDFLALSLSFFLGC